MCDAGQPVRSAKTPETPRRRAMPTPRAELDHGRARTKHYHHPEKLLHGDKTTAGRRRR